MPSILVIGCGSIGERHLRCFLNTKRCTVSACDTNEALLATMRERYGVPTHSSMQEASSEVDAVVICTPAHLHLAMALTLLRQGKHLLIEKPLAIDTSMVPEVREAIGDRVVCVAYVYHMMPWVAEAREFVRSGAIGAIKHASIVCGQHFPTFRPAYREIYYARHDHGGGAIQDALTHVANVMEWIIGPCSQLFADASHQVLEGVTVEDTVNVAARHGDVLVNYALNQFQTPSETVFHFHGEKGSVVIESHLQRWGSMLRGQTTWEWHTTEPLERDELFTQQANAFLDALEGKPHALSSFDEAAQTLKFNQAALESVRTHELIQLA
ncbi:MAG: Gfo/Idh/MocA family oxidoreductase [Verrucomicrobiaceae bacterium]|nr:Gfo/Idh/MocA family oxidoreductase [Verrucomicrobiaceae bacterium]